MGKARQEPTRYDGVYKRVIYGGKRTAYDIKIGNEPFYNVSANLSEAKEIRDRLVAEKQGGGSLKGRQRTLREYVEADWLPRQEARVAEGLRSSTQKGYARDLRNHILPVLGDRRLADVTVVEVQRLTDQLRADGKAAYTVLNVLHALGSVYRLAVSQRLVMFNPVTHVDKPAAKRLREPMRLTGAQVLKLADAASLVDDRNLILVGAFAGLRISEALGLRYEDVSLKDGEETMRVTVQNYKGEWVERPKTRSGKREVPLTPQAVAALRSQLRESNRPNPERLYFPSAEGKPQRDSNWNRRSWHGIRAAAGLPGARFHDLRSFYVSYVRSLSLDSALTMQLTGHADEKTHDDYTYATEGQVALFREVTAAAFEAEAENE
jgi:integrase